MNLDEQLAQAKIGAESKENIQPMKEEESFGDFMEGIMASTLAEEEELAKENAVKNLEVKRLREEAAEKLALVEEKIANLSREGKFDAGAIMYARLVGDSVMENGYMLEMKKKGLEEAKLKLEEYQQLLLSGMYEDFAEVAHTTPEDEKNILEARLKKQEEYIQDLEQDKVTYNPALVEGIQADKIENPSELLDAVSTKVAQHVQFYFDNQAYFDPTLTNLRGSELSFVKGVLSAAFENQDMATAAKALVLSEHMASLSPEDSMEMKKKVMALDAGKRGEFARSYKFEKGAGRNYKADLEALAVSRKEAA